MTVQPAGQEFEERIRPLVNRKLTLWFAEAHIETADLRRGQRARAFVEAVLRIAGEELATSKLIPLRGSPATLEERAALSLAAEVLEDMRPILLAKVPPGIMRPSGRLSPGASSPSPRSGRP